MPRDPSDDPDAMDHARDRAESAAETRRGACRCGNPDMPGRCPGADHCPMAQPDNEDEEKA